MQDRRSGEHPDSDPVQASKEGPPVRPGDEARFKDAPDRSVSDQASYGSNAEQQPGGAAADTAAIIAENTSALGEDDGGPQAGASAHERRGK